MADEQPFAWKQRVGDKVLVRVGDNPSFFLNVGDGFVFEYEVKPAEEPDLVEKTFEVINWSRRARDVSEILAKYIVTVGMNEGVDFLYESEWSPEEWAILKRASARADQLWERQRHGRR